MKKSSIVLGFILLAGCDTIDKEVIKGPAPGIEYRNQGAYPWPWISVIPSERASAFTAVDFDALSRHLHYDMSFEPHYKIFTNVRTVLLDYTMLPPSDSPNEIPTPTSNPNARSKRYFMVASFYLIGNGPPNPPDFEVTASIDATKAGPQEAMRYMAHSIVEDLHSASDSDLLHEGFKITVNLD